MNNTPENKSLIRYGDLELNPWQRIRYVTSWPEIYFAPTIKSILDERDLVPKTGRRLFNPGRSYNGGIHILLPTAYFRWQEPVSNWNEYEPFVSAAIKKCREEGMDIFNYWIAGEDKDISQKDAQLAEEILIPAIEMGRLYDKGIELPIRPESNKCPSNGQKLWNIDLIYGPHPFGNKNTRITTLGGYKDHSNISTPDKATKPSLADIVRGMVPQLEPTG